jgi:hypothetical protein
MNQQQEGNSWPNKGNKKTVGPGLRKTGYIVTIIIMFIMIYVLRHLREWGLTFLTDEFEKCLFYIELAIYVTIGANILFIIYDNRWFRHLVQVLVNAANALSTIMIYVIFPFALDNANWTKWLKIGILIVFVITAISIVVELVKGIRYLVKDADAA